MFNLLDYGSMKSSQWYYMTKQYKHVAMEYKTNNMSIALTRNSEVKGYSGFITMDNITTKISMASLDNPLQRILMKVGNESNIEFYRYDTAKEKDENNFYINIIEGATDFTLSIDKFYTIGIDSGKYAIIYNTKNRIQEKYYILDDNNIGYLSYDQNERPIEFSYYDKSSITSTPLLSDTKYYMMSPNWYTISKDNMRIKSEKFDVISLSGKDTIISFGALSFDPFDWNNNRPGNRYWFSDKLDLLQDKNVFQRNIIEIDEDKEKDLYKDKEKFYISMT